MIVRTRLGAERDILARLALSLARLARILENLAEQSPPRTSEEWLAISRQLADTTEQLYRSTAHLKPQDMRRLADLQQAFLGRN